MSYEHVAQIVYGSPWAIMPEKATAIERFMSRRLAGEHLPTEEVQAAMEAALPRGPRPQSGAVAVIPIYGVISQRASMLQAISGGTSIDAITQQFRQAISDPGIKAVVFDIASPGGSTDGVTELAAEIYAARGRKPVVAVANALCASAAYWLGSAAGDLAVTPSGSVGSIGVLMMHQDDTAADAAAGITTTIISAGRYKAEGWGPLTDDAKAHLQSLVDEAYGQFVADVARGRGTTAADVRKGFGQGRMVTAREAVRQGMADRVATLDEVVGRLAGGGATTKLAAEGDAPLMVAEDLEPEVLAVAGVDPDVANRLTRLRSR